MVIYLINCKFFLLDNRSFPWCVVLQTSFLLLWFLSSYLIYSNAVFLRYYPLYLQNEWNLFCSCDVETSKEFYDPHWSVVSFSPHRVSQPLSVLLFTDLVPCITCCNHRLKPTLPAILRRKKIEQGTLQADYDKQYFYGSVFKSVLILLSRWLKLWSRAENSRCRCSCDEDEAEERECLRGAERKRGRGGGTWLTCTVSLLPVQHWC